MHGTSPASRPAPAPRRSAHVVFHPVLGVFVGEAMGLGFWSRLDPVGQASAATFPTRAAALEFIDGPEAPRGSPDGEGALDALLWRVVEVEPDIGGRWASISEIARVGLPAWNPAGP